MNEEHGGAQQLLYDLCVHLPTDEFKLTVFYMFGDGTFRSDLEAAGARVVALDASSNYDLWAFSRFVRHLRVDPPDVLHTNSPISGTWGRIAGEIVGIPRLVSVEHHVHDTRRLFVRLIDDVTLPSAHSVVGVSEAVTASFSPWERFFLNFSNTDIKTITNGVNVDTIDAESCDTNNVLTSYPIEPTDPIIGTVGRMVEKKGYRYLIDSMERVTHEHPNAKLLMVGDGPIRMALQQRARHQGLNSGDEADTVVFTGYQPSVPPFLAHFDIGVFPSLEESFGLALAEAMAANTPVIASDIPAFRNVVGDAGVLVPRRDSTALAAAINKLLADDSRRKQLRVQGRGRIEQCFSIEHTAREYADLYRNVITDPT